MDTGYWHLSNECPSAPFTIISSSVCLCYLHLLLLLILHITPLLLKTFLNFQYPNYFLRLKKKDLFSFSICFQKNDLFTFYMIYLRSQDFSTFGITLIQNHKIEVFFLFLNSVLGQVGGSIFLDLTCVKFIAF